MTQDLAKVILDEEAPVEDRKNAAQQWWGLNRESGPESEWTRAHASWLMGCRPRPPFEISDFY